MPVTTAADEPDDGTISGTDSEPGGETVCWAHLVCPECGGMSTSARPEVCDRCGGDFPD